MILATGSLGLWLVGASAGAEPQPAQTAQTTSFRPHLDLDLDPPRRPNESLWIQWQRRTSEIMTSRRSSGVYQQSASGMSAWWRLAAFDREAPWLSPAEAARARDLAQYGAMAGIAAVFADTMQASPPLQALHGIVTTAGGAHLRVEGPRRRQRSQDPDAPSPKLRLRYNDRPGEQGLAETQILASDGRQAGPPRPSLATGASWRLTDADPDEAVLDPSLSLTGYLDLRQLPVDAIRLQLSLPMPELEASRKAAAQPAWTGSRLSATLRQGLLPQTDLVGNVRVLATENVLPESASLGLSVRLPFEQPWTLRPELRNTFARPVEAERAAVPSEWIAGISLRAELGWHLPQQWGRWPLGREIDAVGPEPY